LLFGVAEIMRSKIGISYLQSNQTDEFGKLMKISHDGDRVSRAGADGKYVRLEENCSDEYLARLIQDLDSKDPEKTADAQLQMQPGNYACSTVEIDQMVDIACSVPSVAGAQIAGAGLGGCIMIMAKKESVEAVREALTTGYYRPKGLEPVIIPCMMVEGAGLVQF
jgi:N-acetylgalactosamine kinase